MPPPRGTPANICICLIFPENSHWATFLSLIYGPIFVRLAIVASQKYELAQNSMKIWTYSSSRSSKVIHFGTNRKHTGDFLLVINSNYGPNLHRFWDTATYWLKIVYFSYLSYSVPPLPMFPLEFCSEVNREETSHGLLSGESCMILSSSVFDWSTGVTDRQTDRETDGGTGDSI